MLAFLLLLACYYWRAVAGVPAIYSISVLAGVSAVTSIPSDPDVTALVGILTFYKTKRTRITLSGYRTTAVERIIFHTKKWRLRELNVLSDQGLNLWDYRIATDKKLSVAKHQAGMYRTA